MRFHSSADRYRPTSWEYYRVCTTLSRSNYLGTSSCSFGASNWGNIEPNPLANVVEEQSLVKDGTCWIVPVGPKQSPFTGLTTGPVVHQIVARRVPSTLHTSHRPVRLGTLACVQPLLMLSMPSPPVNSCLPLAASLASWDIGRLFVQVGGTG